MATPLMLDDDLYDRLSHLASERAQSTEAFVLEAVEAFEERSGRRADFIAEADASWAGFQHDGLHLTGAEAGEWLDRWNKDEAPPACHT